MPDGSDRVLVVPCGKCLACRISRVREWKVRMLHELEYHDNAVFLTLTYDDDHIPEDGSLDKSHFQKFMKRLRKDLGSSYSLKYYAVGEYGSETYRPHYHAIVFGIGPESSDVLADNWNMGFVKVGDVNADSIGYVCGYIFDKLSGPMAELYEGRVPPFSLMSKGIGKRFVEEYKDVLEKNLHVTVGGVPQALPRYYVKNLEIDKERLKEAGDVKYNDTLEYWEKRGFLEADTLKQINKAREQADANLKGMVSLKKRDKV